ncbi:MAG: ligand-binding protein SH3 [Planctomycetota bacterium]|nr:MAG: ligand-binding protein SH3 [Planctomycetota bacterium]
MEVTVTKPHRSHYPNPIELHPGEEVSVVTEDPSHPGWIRVRTSDGNEGWAPKDYLQESSNAKATALVKYTARELNTDEGEKLIVHSELHGWIWVENQNGQCGWVPRETVAVP